MNTIYLLLEKILKFAIIFTTNIFVINYLGPEKFGIMAFVTSLISIMIVFCSFGINQILLREILVNEEEAHQLIFNAIYFTIFVSVIVSILMLIVMMYFEYGELIINLMIISTFNLCIHSLLTLKIWFQAKVIGKYILISGFLGSAVSGILKILAVFLQLNLEAFVAIGGIETAITSATLFFIYIKYVFKQGRLNLKPKIKYIKSLIYLGWPFLLSVAANQMLLRVDQIMIGQLGNFSSLGQYALATRINEIFFFLPSIVISSFSPRIYKIFHENSHRNSKGLRSFILLMFITGVLVSIFFFVFGGVIIKNIFGEKYLPSAPMLNILNLGLIIVLWTSVRPIYLRAFNLGKYNAIVMFLGLFLNIILNYIVIPIYGAIGACYTTLATWVFINLICDVFYQPARDIIIMQVNSFKIFMNLGR